MKTINDLFSVQPTQYPRAKRERKIMKARAKVPRTILRARGERESNSPMSR
ncbi:MAG: hypothetical protein UX92_C0001G0001, partial [Candidatus Amesbacteria bacterium GW2011_GWA1_47_20]